MQKNTKHYSNRLRKGLQKVKNIRDTNNSDIEIKESSGEIPELFLYDFILIIHAFNFFVFLSATKVSIMKTLFLAAGLLLIVSCKNEREKASYKASVSRNSLVIKRDSMQSDNEEDPIAENKKEYAALQAQLETKKLSSSKFNENLNWVYLN